MSESELEAGGASGHPPASKLHDPSLAAHPNHGRLWGTGIGPDSRAPGSEGPGNLDPNQHPHFPNPPVILSQHLRTLTSSQTLPFQGRDVRPREAESPAQVTTHTLEPTRAGRKDLSPLHSSSVPSSGKSLPGLASQC